MSSALVTALLPCATKKTLLTIDRYAQHSGQTFEACIREALTDYVEVKIPPREAALFHGETEKA